jgi:branched-chain amino acid transport system substrate-binding protein
MSIPHLVFRLSALAAVAALALGGAGCSSGPELPKGGPQTLAMGAVAPLSGPNALVGRSLQRGLELGAADVNAAGGVNGKPVALAVLDSQSDIIEGGKAIQRWRDRNVPILLLAEPSLAAYFATDLGDAPQLVGFLSDYVPVPTLTPKNGVRIFLNGDQEGRLIENYLAAAGINKAAVLYVGTLAGKSQAQYMAFLLHGDYIGVYEDAYTATETDYRLLAEYMPRENAEAIVLAGYGREYPTILAAFDHAGWNGLVLGYVGQDTLAGLSGQTGLASKLLFPVPEFVINPRGTPEGRAFADEYRAKYGEDPDLPAAYGYDNVRILALAAQDANSFDPQKIRAAYLALNTYAGAAGTYTIKHDGDTEMPLLLVDGNGQLAPPPAKPQLPPEISHVNMPGQLGPSFQGVFTPPAKKAAPAGNTTATPTPAAPSP